VDGRILVGYWHPRMKRKGKKQKAKRYSHRRTEASYGEEVTEANGRLGIPKNARGKIRGQRYKGAR